MITIACVLRSVRLDNERSDFGPIDVQHLAAGVDRHLPLPYRFVCLSDVLVSNVECIPLPASTQRGWWAKMALFTPGLLRGRCLYLDLDSVIVSDLSDLADYDGAFGCIGDFYRPALSQSGVLAWDADGPLAREVWDRWSANPGHAMTTLHGDGNLIADVLAGREDRLDRLYPGQLASYKVHVVPSGRVPRGARVVCFHGSPRPAQICGTHPLAVEWRRA